MIFFEKYQVFFTKIGDIFYDYSQILFSTLFGLVFFGQFPDWMSLAGYIIIISMAIVNYIYTHRHAEAAEVEDTSESAESSPAPAPQESN